MSIKVQPRSHHLGSVELQRLFWSHKIFCFSGRYIKNVTLCSLKNVYCRNCVPFLSVLVNKFLAILTFYCIFDKLLKTVFFVCCILTFYSFFSGQFILAQHLIVYMFKRPGVAGAALLTPS